MRYKQFLHAGYQDQLAAVRDYLMHIASHEGQQLSIYELFQLLVETENQGNYKGLLLKALPGYLGLTAFLLELYDDLGFSLTEEESWLLDELHTTGSKLSQSLAA